MTRALHILLVMGLCSTAVFAQHDKFTKSAIKSYQAKDYEGARVHLDSAMSSGLASENALSWNLRGVVYHYLSRKKKSRDYRQEALNAFLKAQELDVNRKLQPLPEESLPVVVEDYYVDVDSLLSAGKLNEAKNAYLNYRDLYLNHIESTYDFTDNDIEFYSALGTVYKDLYEASKDSTTRSKLKASALEMFHQVLTLDSSHFVSLYNIGVIHYNQGVAMRIFISPDCDLDCVREVRDASREIFRTARPYLERAYEANNKRPAIWQALASIYYELNEKELFKKFDKMLQDLERGGR